MHIFVEIVIFVVIFIEAQPSATILLPLVINWHAFSVADSSCSVLSYCPRCPYSMRSRV